MRRLLDPALFIPGSSQESELSFWLRYVQVSQHVSRDVGPASFLAFHDKFSSSEPPAPGIAPHDWIRLVHAMNPVPPVPNRPRSDEEAARVSDYEPLADSCSLRELLISDLSQGDEPWELVSVHENWSSERNGLGGPLDAVFVERADRRSDESGVRPPLLISMLDAGGFVAPWGVRLELIERGVTSVDEIAEKSREMFPRVEFSDNVWAGWKGVGKKETDMAPRILHHLCVLNDVCPEIWSQDLSEREARLGHFGITASAESNKTRKSAKKMKMRDFAFSGATVRCEWHTKLWSVVGRIHFQVVKSQVYVGCVVKHLPT